ncbi:MAG: energy transducer TonB [Flavobacteriales bacterium]
MLRLNLFRILASLVLSVGLSAAAPAQRTWLDNGLLPCTRSQATFYLEGNGMEDMHHKAKIFNLDGTLKGEGTYYDAEYRIADGLFTYYWPTGRVESSGQFLNGKKDGVWKRYDKWGGELAEKVYDISHLANLVYTMAQTMPDYPGGEKAMVHYLKDEVGKTPKNSFATFVVEKDGHVGDVVIVGVEDPALKEKITKSISTPLWQAGVQDGQPVRVKMRVPLN